MSREGNVGGKEGLTINVQEEKGVLYFDGGNSLISCTYILDKYMSKLIKLYTLHMSSLLYVN